MNRPNIEHQWLLAGAIPLIKNWQFSVILGILSQHMREKNGKMGVSGRICLYVACYDFVLGFNVSSSPLMFFQVGFWG